MRSLLAWLTAVLTVLLAAGWIGLRLTAAPARVDVPSPVQPARATESPRFSTTLRPGPATPRVRTGTADAQGPITVACSTCHQTTKPNPELRSAAELKQFHRGLEYRHGSLTCLSCHQASNYDALRLADGSTIPFAETMTLCSQCHGQKRRDYDHGAHGGMQGFWDLSRGPRTRNTCVHCHDPHAPAQPFVQPVLPPRDRLSVPAKSP
ncbi:MAG: hypothetical protein JSR82_02285 [Verrucomicrobia bacterium]|nr:hypothetical protein [Verrucomicrobiota bacterium]